MKTVALSMPGSGTHVCASCANSSRVSSGNFALAKCPSIVPEFCGERHSCYSKTLVYLSVLRDDSELLLPDQSDRIG